MMIDSGKNQNGTPSLYANCVLFIVGALAIALSSLAAARNAGGQTLGAEVRDESGSALAGATVELRCGGSVVRATTGAAGTSTLPGPAAGDCSVSVWRNGGTAAGTSAVSFPRAGSRLVLQLSADGSLLILPETAAQTGTGGEQLSSKAVSELPLNKRDFSQLLLLAAGTMTDTNGAANFTQQFAVNGQRGTAAVFAMDGADSSDPEMGGTTFSNFNVDAVQEIRSSSGWMPAEIGRGAAGFTDIITRSGTNSLHGSVFEFLRNAALDSRNFFDRRSLANPGRIPPFTRNEFGVTNGGPVVIPHVYDGRNRTYYFAEYQGFRQVLGTTQVLSVPTAAERAGYDTTAFPGDTLIAPVDPRIAKLLARYPLPNDPQGPYGERTYATSSKVTTVSDQFSARIDHRISDKSQLFGRFSFDDITGPTTNPSQTAIARDFAVEFVNRQRNAVVTYKRTPSPAFLWEISASFTRTTPSFPTLNRTDPGLKFGDGLYEPFNSAAGSVMGAYGNLFQIRHNVTWTRNKHTWQAGAEVRANRDTTVFGTGPNGEYQFGGGAAYSPVAIRSASGAHDIHPGDPLPDSLTGLLTASAFTYSVAVAPPMFAQGDHIGDSAIHRDAYNFYFQDTWKLSGRLALSYGVRYEIDSPIRERAKRTSGPVLNGAGGGVPGSGFLINPDPGFRWDKKGWGPRVALRVRAARKTRLLAGAGITTLIPNLWLDNALTGGTPFVVYPRLTAASGQPVRFGSAITPEQLPAVYTTSGSLVFASGNSRNVPGNTVMDVVRFERDLAALTPDHQIAPLALWGISGDFQNGYIGTWTAGVEQELQGITLNAAYVGTAGNKLHVNDYPNGYAGADAAFTPYTQSDSSGHVTGGYGVVTLVTNRAHSTYHSLQLSAQNTLGRSGLGFQASYSFAKSLDDASAVNGSQSTPADPFHTSLEKGPSTFDIRHAASLSFFQDLHADRAPFLRPFGKTLTAGWQLLGIGSLMSGLPFTVNSGVQQSGVGSMGTERPDQIGLPDLSTSRTVREDYFGRGSNNAAFFSIPIHVPGGTGPNQGRLGTLGRNTFRGPVFHNFDAALIKDTPLLRKAGAERATLQFRVEFFNVFNLVNFGLPSNIVMGPGFGVISKTAGSSRQIQFSLKVMY
jgi:hypothetical protein